MASNTDGRGVVRGKCSECDCRLFVNPTTGFDCTDCTHKSIKHENLTPGYSKSLGTPETTQPSTSPRTSQLYNNTFPDHMQPFRSQPSYSSVAASGHSTGWGTGTSGCGQMTYTSAGMYSSSYHDNDWPKCEGCKKKPVFYDEHFGHFKYCSPKCRDDTILEKYDEKLRRDVELFSMLGDATHIQQSPRQSLHSNERSSLATQEKSSPLATSSHEGTTCSHVQREPIDTNLERNVIILRSEQKEESGFLFRKDEETKHVVIIGAKSPEAIENLKDGTVHLYDRVVKIKLAFDPSAREISTVQQVKDLIKDKTEFEFTLKRHPTIQIDLSSFFRITSAEPVPVSKIVLLRYIPGKPFGVRVESHDKLLGISNDSIAYKSGLRNSDKLQYYAAVRDKEVVEVIRAFMSFDKEINHDFGECKKNNHHLLLATD